MNDIIKTTDYTIFRKMKGNRDVEPRRVKMITDSIKKIGWISNPIIVNKKMEIIDGQGRFEALKNLGLPVEYHIVENAKLDDCRMMNNSMMKWNTKDYIYSYAVTGNENYKRVKTLMEYFDVTIDIIALAKNYKSNLLSSNGQDYRQMREGKLEFTESDYINVSRMLNIYKPYKEVFKKFGGRTNTKDRVIFYLIHYADKYGTLDHEKMLEALRKCDPETVYNLGFDRLLESVQNAYNHNKAKKSRLYFYEEYRIDKKIS